MRNGQKDQEIYDNKELHSKRDVAQFYVSSKNGGKGLIQCKDLIKWVRVVSQKQSRTITSCSQNM